MINSQQAVAETLSVTMMAFGQAICNEERRFGQKSLEEIAREWLCKAALMQRSEWIAGRDSLLHYLKHMNSQSALNAISVLTSPLSDYERNSRLFKGIYRQRRKKPDSLYLNATKDICRAYQIPIPSRLEIEIHGGTKGVNPEIEQFSGSGIQRSWGESNE